MHEVAVVIPMGVLHIGPDAGEGSGNSFGAFDLVAVFLVATNGVEHAVIGKMGHHGFNVVAIESVKSIGQILSGQYLAHRSFFLDSGLFGVVPVGHDESWDICTA